MDIGSILLILAVFVLAAGFVMRPLLEAESDMVSEEEQNLSSLMAERERILNALAELDFDHTMGKVPEEIYPVRRQQLAEAGVEILRMIDKQQQNGARVVPAQISEPVLSERKKPVEEGKEEEDPLEALIAARRDQQGVPLPGKYCSQCGQGVLPGDKFCSHCGIVLT